jgi:4-hydroxyacetophenone monooxygenase
MWAWPHATPVLARRGRRRALLARFSRVPTGAILPEAIVAPPWSCLPSAAVASCGGFRNPQTFAQAGIDFSATVRGGCAPGEIRLPGQPDPDRNPASARRDSRPLPPRLLCLRSAPSDILTAQSTDGASAYGRGVTRGDVAKGEESMERDHNQLRAGFGPESGPRQVNREALGAAMGEANIPVLLMVLVQLTGDRRWLEDPYRPTRTRGMSDHRDGGLPEVIQDEIRAAALKAVLQGASGRPAAITVPDDALLAEMMSVCMGEEVPAGYVPMMAEEMGFKARYKAWDGSVPQSGPGAFRVLIIGGGVSGLCMAIKCKEAGIPFVVAEKNPSIGGTWFENRYPDCGVDTPSYLYSFSFAQVQWPEYFSKGYTVQDYLERVAVDYGLNDSIRLSTKVVSAEYDEQSSLWKVTTSVEGGAESIEHYNAVISAVGQLNQPKIPALPGLGDFEGTAFHSARWPVNADLRGKRVAVVGTGASAMQFVPVIAQTAEHLTIFQRSPQWVAPNEDYGRAVCDADHALIAEVPFYGAWYRMRLAWTFGDKVHATLRRDPDWEHPERSVNSVNDGHRRYFTRYMADELGARADLLEKVVPSYPPFGKRMLLDNGWFTALTRDNVELVTDRIARVEPTGVATEGGTLHEADALVLATGFETQRMLDSVDVRGRAGTSLRDSWGDDDPRAYMGMTMPGFPNFFCLYGPNTNLGHGGSLIFLSECQVRYIVDLFTQMIDKGIAAVDCAQEVHDAYNVRVDKAHEGLIWTHKGMDTWYRNRAGRVVANSPWTLLEHWTMTREPVLANYELTYSGPATSTGADGSASADG